MTYNVFSGTLNPTHFTLLGDPVDGPTLDDPVDDPTLCQPELDLYQHHQLCEFY